MEIQVIGRWYYFKNLAKAKEFFKDGVLTKMACGPIFKHRIIKNHVFGGAYVLATQEVHDEIKKRMEDEE